MDTLPSESLQPMITWKIVCCSWCVTDLALWRLVFFDKKWSNKVEFSCFSFRAVIASVYPDNKLAVSIPPNTSFDMLATVTVLFSVFLSTQGRIVRSSSLDQRVFSCTINTNYIIGSISFWSLDASCARRLRRVDCIAVSAISLDTPGLIMMIERGRWRELR